MYCNFFESRAQTTVATVFGAVSATFVSTSSVNVMIRLNTYWYRNRPS